MAEIKSGTSWVVIIVSLIAAPLLVYIGERTFDRYQQKASGSGGPGQSETGTTTNKNVDTKTPCAVHGMVFNSDNNSGLANVDIGIRPAVGSKETMASTDNTGHFSFPCNTLPAEAFQFSVYATLPAWRGQEIEAKETIRSTGHDALNIYVSLKDIARILRNSSRS
ncbi:MAG: hypothetical protein QOK37_3421 [Thermoanaerobaculia bacterium]|jgi:hypothetical protein|nr:hypothetical protein [Thermoanaerobaculia bacterium]